MRPGHAGNGVVIKMDLNRVALKADARRRAAGYRPSPILAALIVFALGLLISTLSSYLMGGDRLTTALTNAAQFGPDAVEQAYISFFEHYSVSGVAVVLVVALEIMNYMVSVGFVIFSLHVSRDETAEIGNLFDGFGLFFRVLWLAILQGLFVFLWSLLLVRVGPYRASPRPIATGRRCTCCSTTRRSPPGSACARAQRSCAATSGSCLCWI